MVFSVLVYNLLEPEKDICFAISSTLLIENLKLKSHHSTVTLVWCEYQALALT